MQPEPPAATTDEPAHRPHDALQDMTLGLAAISVRCQPATEVFEFSFDETTTVSALKDWLSAHVGGNDPHMHLRYGLTHLRDEIPLSQYVGRGDAVVAQPKRGG